KKGYCRLSNYALGERADYLRWSADDHKPPIPDLAPCAAISGLDPSRPLSLRAGNGPPAPSGRPVPGQRMVRRLNIDGDAQGDLIWKTERFERLWIATGPPPMRTTSRGSTRFTERTRCSNIRNRASASAGGGRFSRLAPRSRTGNASQCGG